jgi:alpha-L-fucosidase
MTPPAVTLRRVTWDAATDTATLEGELTDMGGAREVEVGFEFRNVKGLDLTERPDAYAQTPMLKRTSPGAFTLRVKGWQAGDVMEVRSAVKHPLITAYSREEKFPVGTSGRSR